MEIKLLVYELKSNSHCMQITKQLITGVITQGVKINMCKI